MNNYDPLGKQQLIHLILLIAPVFSLINEESKLKARNP